MQDKMGFTSFRYMLLFILKYQDDYVSTNQRKVKLTLRYLKTKFGQWAHNTIEFLGGLHASKSLSKSVSQLVV